MDPQASGNQDTSQGTPPAESTGQSQNQAQDAQSGSSQGAQDSVSQRISRGVNEWLRGGGRSVTVDANERRSQPQPSEQAESQEPTTESPGDATAKAERQAQAARSRSLLEGDGAEPVTLTREELRRQVQSEKDRQIAAENRRNYEMAQVRATAAQYDRLKELADPNTGDPERLMEAVNDLLNNRDTQLQQHQRQIELQTHVKATGDSYDNLVVKPILDQLPESVARRIVEESPQDLVGIEHRAHLVQEALVALKAQITQEVTAKVRQQLSRSDSFRKDVLHEATDRRAEPEVVQPVAASNGSNRDMNTWLRTAIRP